jgi:DNA-binding response OmpR family regulator
MHVLVVDDDPLILQLCSIILDKASIRFTRCHEPQQLYGTAIDISITYILLDIRMANVSGIDLCQYLRKKVDPHVKIIAMSAQIPSDPQSLIAVGFDAILTKPFREQDLYSVLHLHPTTSVPIVSNTDFAGLKKLTLNDDELFQSVLTEFITETESDVQQLLTHLNSHKTDDILLIVHKLAGRLGQMGFVEASHQWLQLEKEGQNGMTWSSLHYRATELIESLQVIVKHSRQHITATP